MSNYIRRLSLNSYLSALMLNFKFVTYSLKYHYKVQYRSSISKQVIWADFQSYTKLLLYRISNTMFKYKVTEVKILQNLDIHTVLQQSITYFFQPIILKHPNPPTVTLPHLRRLLRPFGPDPTTPVQSPLKSLPRPILTPLLPTSTSTRPEESFVSPFQPMPRTG